MSLPSIVKISQQRHTVATRLQIEPIGPSLLMWWKWSQAAANNSTIATRVYKTIAHPIKPTDTPSARKRKRYYILFIKWMNELLWSDHKRTIRKRVIRQYSYYENVHHDIAVWINNYHETMRLTI